jgi:hypothetical protein
MNRVSAPVTNARHVPCADGGRSQFSVQRERNGSAVALVGMDVSEGRIGGALRLAPTAPRVERMDDRVPSVAVSDGVVSGEVRTSDMHAPSAPAIGLLPGDRPPKTER